MLAGAPLMVAQLGALELRKKMLEGDTQILRQLNLTTPAIVLQVLKWLQKAPPFSVFFSPWQIFVPVANFEKVPVQGKKVPVAKKT